MKKKLRFAFLVQGEGRGHMTQAIAMQEILKRNGHEVCLVSIGTSGRRKVPEYFEKAFECEVLKLRSPNFVSDKKNRSIRLLPSIAYNTRFLITYLKSLRAIDEKVKEIKPDVIINFYDFLGGFYFLLFKPKAKRISIAHQFLADHPSFPFAKNNALEEWLFKRNNSLMSLNAHKKLALSFRAFNPGKIGTTVVVPPLIRKEVIALQPKKEDFLLAYMVNDGYAEEIMDWQKNNPDVEIHCFWDRKEMPDPYSPHPKLTFHQLDNVKFLEYMKSCKGYVSTAGFESICEAMYLGKPVLMIPVEGQYEQHCNALDAVAAGAGISNSTFDIQKLFDYLPRHKDVQQEFVEWYEKGEKMIVKELEEA